MTRRRKLISAAVLLIAMSGVTSVQADARSDADQAQRRLDDTECRLRNLNAAVQQAQCNYDSAAASRAAAISALQSAQQQVVNSSASINDMNARIVTYTQAARDASELASRRQAECDAAKAQLNEASRAADQYRANVQASFDASPALKFTNGELAAASTAYQTAYDASFLWLRGTIEYFDLYAGVEDFTAQVESQRASVPMNQAVLAATSAAWIDSLNALRKFRDDYLARDPQVAGARQRLLVAQAQHKSLIDAFHRDLANDPRLKGLLDDAANVQSAVAAAARDINTANANRASAESAIAQLQAAIVSEQDRLASAQRDTAALASSIDSYWYAISSAQSELSRLCLLRDAAARDYQHAAGDLRRTIEIANAEHARREVEAHSGDSRRREAELASSRQHGQTPVIVVEGNQPGRVEQREREDRHRREPERRDDPPRERPPVAHVEPPQAVRPQTTLAEDERRQARGEEAVARRQAIDARQAPEPRPQDAQPRLQSTEARQSNPPLVAQSRTPANNTDPAVTKSRDRDQASAEAKQRAEQNVKPQSERDAKRQPDREVKQSADREAKQQADRATKQESDQKARQQAEREAKQQADRDAKSQAEQQRREAQQRQADESRRESQK